MGHHLRPVALSHDITLARQRVVLALRVCVCNSVHLCECLCMWNCILCAWMSQSTTLWWLRGYNLHQVCKGKTCVSRGSQRSTQIYRGKWHIPFLTGSVKMWNRARCWDKTHLWGTTAKIINLNLEDGDRHLEPYNEEPSKTERA